MSLFDGTPDAALHSSREPGLTNEDINSTDEEEAGAEQIA